MNLTDTGRKTTEGLIEEESRDTENSHFKNWKLYG